MKGLLFIALVLLASCGVHGPPIPPEGAVEPVATEGIELVPPKGSI